MYQIPDHAHAFAKALYASNGAPCEGPATWRRRSHRGKRSPARSQRRWLFLWILSFILCAPASDAGPQISRNLSPQDRLSLTGNDLCRNRSPLPDGEEAFSLSLTLDGGDVAENHQSQGNIYGFIYPDTVNRRRATSIYTVMGAYAVGLGLFYNFVWYGDYERVPFQFYDDNRDWLQMDKHGHLYATYQQTRGLYHLFRWVGYPKNQALWISSPIAFFLHQFQVDLWDGFYEGDGFSIGDIVANAVGVGWFTIQEALWDEQILKLTYSYYPSPYRELYPRELRGNPVKNIGADYNGHTQWISGSLRRLTGIEAFPSWLCISVGFSADGMLRKVDNSGVPGYEDLPRYRQIFLSLDVDWSGLSPRNPLLRGLVFLADAIKFPAPALEYNPVDGFRLRPLYF